MTPVLRYIILNIDILSYADIARIGFFFFSLAFVLTIIIPLVYGFITSNKALMILGAVFCFVVLNMASLSSNYNWHENGNFYIQMAFFIFFFLMVFLSYVANKTIAYTIILAFFIVDIGVSLYNLDWESTKLKNNQPISKIYEYGRENKIKKPTDVLFLVYESYANYETLKHYGIDNSEHLDFLVSNDFHIYHGTYSLGAPTIPSISRVFTLDADLDFHRKHITGLSSVHQLLRLHNYNTYGIFFSDYVFRNLDRSMVRYDFSFPVSIMNNQSLINSILAGEFSDKFALAPVDYDTYIHTKNKVLNKNSTSPLFLYSHSQHPNHRPSTSFSTDDVEKYINRYKERLHIANEEMRQDVYLIDEKHPNAIVIIAGDHGPFLTKSGYGLRQGKGGFDKSDVDRFDIQDRFGTFLAVRWPEENYAKTHNIEILQDIFPAVFSFLFDDNAFFDKTRMNRISDSTRTLGVYVHNGKIVGGKNDGEKLFIYNAN